MSPGYASSGRLAPAEQDLRMLSGKRPAHLSPLRGPDNARENVKILGDVDAQMYLCPVPDRARWQWASSRMISVLSRI